MVGSQILGLCSELLGTPYNHHPSRMSPGVPHLWVVTTSIPFPVETISFIQGPERKFSVFIHPSLTHITLRDLDFPRDSPGTSAVTRNYKEPDYFPEMEKWGRRKNTETKIKPISQSFCHMYFC